MRLAGALIVLVQYAGATCTSDLQCSLNGVCTNGECICDRPWTGSSCGILAYATTPATGKSLFPYPEKGNTWNGAIIRAPEDGLYHLYNPLYPKGELGGTTTMMHATSPNITGPYAWGKYPDIILDTSLGAFNGPKSVVFPDPITNKTKFSLWLGGGVYLADSPNGPFERLKGFAYPGSNPAPWWHNGTFYFTNSPCQTVYSTPRLVAGAQWSVHGKIDHTGVPEGWIPEDSDLWVDLRGNFHIINHAYDPRQWEHCSTSVLSSHFFSKDGAVWHFLPEAIQPYSHTVQYDDGTNHMFITIERPNVFLDELGRLTHIHLAADGVSGDAGCGNRTEHQHFGHCPCDNCKYEDQGTTTIIALDV